MDTINQNVSLSLHKEEGKVVAPLSSQENCVKEDSFFHDKICSTLPDGPLSPMAATDDSSQMDIGNVLSLEVPDTPSNASQSQGEEDELTAVSNEWNLVHVSEPENSIVLETITDDRDSIPTHVESNPPQQEANTAASSPEEVSPPESGLSEGDFQELRRLQQEEAVKESTKEPFDPMRMLRKGGVAVLGGTMVGVGLIMIPLPTPFGVVVASSGMAVLSAEFEGAKVLNQKITETTKKHWDAARENIIKNIEEMEGAGRPSTIDGPEDHESKDVNENGESVDGEEGKQAPQGKSTQPNIFDQWKRSTGAYLSRNLVPILKRYEVEGGSVPDADVTVQSETETISDMEQGDDLGTDSNGLAASEDETVVAIAQQQ